jgi:hypothetical protein
MSNLISDIDHNVFDLEWAKHGGFIIGRTGGVAKLISPTVLGDLLVYDLKEIRAKHVLADELRMATPQECDAAGVEYTKPPMGG